MEIEYDIEYKLAIRSLFIMEADARRMKHMIKLGYYCNEYSEEEWQKFKKVEFELKKKHPDYITL